MARKTIHNDAGKLARYIQYEIEYAARLSINDAAIELQKAFNDATNKFVDGATKFTQKSFIVSKFAKKSKADMQVTAMPRQDSYLSFAMDGGDRKPDGQRKTVMMPGVAMKLTKEGNIPRNFIKRNAKNFGSPRSAGKLFRGTIRSRHGETLTGIFKREITQRRTKTRRQEQRLRALVLFKDRVRHSSSRDFLSAYNKAHDTVVMSVLNRQMAIRIGEIKQHGRVLPRSLRRS